MLNEQRARKVDRVVPASKVKFVDGMLIINGFARTHVAAETENGVVE